MPMSVALSIRQPWAWAILHAGKDIENRSWPTNHRGDFYIHAAKGMSKAEYADFRDFYEQTVRPFNPNAPQCPAPSDLAFGGIIGRAQLVDCVKAHASPWFCGKYGFVIANVRPLKFQALRGQLGFFTVSKDDFK